MNIAEQELYLIAHAPQTIPDWFQPKMRERPKLITYPTDKYRELTKYYNIDEGFWYDDAPKDLKNEAQAYMDKFQAHLDDTDAWDKEYNYERLIQWPFFWSKEVLKRYQDG